MTSATPRWAIDALVAVAILVIAGPIAQVYNAQVASRYALTVAAVDDRTLQIDPYVDVLGVDRAEYEGHTYSDKAPYQPLLAAAPYAAFRAVGGEAFPVVDGRQMVNRSTHWGLWWVTLWSATLPAMVLGVALRRLLVRHGSAHATEVALALVLGTTILPFASWLFGHVAAAMWVGLAWFALHPRNPSNRACALAGLCLGAGIGTEYTVSVIALLLLVDLAMRRRLAASLWLSAGTVVATVPLLIYNWVVFDNPFEVSYQGHLPNFQGSGAFGVFNLTAPEPGEVWRALLGGRGLFVLTPIAVFAAVGCVRALRAGGELRRDGWLAATAFAGFILISTGIDGLGGDSPGPRYLIPIFPLLAVPLAEAWRRFPLPCGVAAGIGGLTMWAATVTDPAIRSRSANAVSVWFEDLIGGDLVPNVITGRDHPWVVVATTMAGLAVAAAAIRAARTDATT